MWNSIKNFFTSAAARADAATFTSAPEINASGHFLGKLARFITSPLRILADAIAGKPGSGLGGWLGRQGGESVSFARKLFTSVLSHEHAIVHMPDNGKIMNTIGRGAASTARWGLIIGSTYGLYKWTQRKISDHKENNEIDALNERAAMIEANTAEKIYDYRQTQMASAYQTAPASAYQVGNGYVGNRAVSSNHAQTVQAARQQQPLQPELIDAAPAR